MPLNRLMLCYSTFRRKGSLHHPPILLYLPSSTRGLTARRSLLVLYNCTSSGSSKMTKSPISLAGAAALAVTYLHHRTHAHYYLAKHDLPGTITSHYIWCHAAPNITHLTHISRAIHHLHMALLRTISLTFLFSRYRGCSGIAGMPIGCGSDTPRLRAHRLGVCARLRS